MNISGVSKTEINYPSHTRQTYILNIKTIKTHGVQAIVYRYFGLYGIRLAFLYHPGRWV